MSDPDCDLSGICLPPSDFMIVHICPERLIFNRVSYPTSMGENHRDICLIEDQAGCAAKDQLGQPALRIGTFEH